MDKPGGTTGTQVYDPCPPRVVAESFFHFLQRRYGIEVDPTDNLRGPKLEKVLPSFVPRDEIEAIIDGFGTDVDNEDFETVRNDLIVTMLYTTGMRAAELVGLKDVAVDTRAGELKVLGKRNKERIIPFGDELRTMITHYRQIRDKVVPDCSSGAFLCVSAERQSITDWCTRPSAQRSMKPM